MRKDTKVFKGHAVQRYEGHQGFGCAYVGGLWGNLVCVVHHRCAVHDGGILKNFKEDPKGDSRRSILKETQTPRRTCNVTLLLATNQKVFSLTLYWG